MHEPKDLTGLKFGRLTVIEKQGSDRHGVKWLCECDCGNTKTTYSHRLTGGSVQSCDCFQRDYNALRFYKHGMTNTRLFNIWSSMRERCTNSNAINYKNYGGRGITICGEWHEFQNFMDWAMSNGYDKNLSIDRIDNNGNYEPSNCRWVTPKVNSNNRRNSVFATYRGETKSISDWEEQFGTYMGALRYRLLVRNMDIGTAVSHLEDCQKVRTERNGACGGIG